MYRINKAQYYTERSKPLITLQIAIIKLQIIYLSNKLTGY